MPETWKDFDVFQKAIQEAGFPVSLSMDLVGASDLRQLVHAHHQDVLYDKKMGQIER